MENTIDTETLMTRADRFSRWLWLWNQVDTDNPMTWQEVASLQGGNANGSGSHGESHDRRGEQEQSEEVQEIPEDREVSNQPQPIATPARTVTGTAVPSESAAADVQDPGSSEFLQENPVDRETLTTRERRQSLSVAGCLRWLRGLDWLGTPVPVHDPRSEEDDQLEQANGGWSHGQLSDRRGEQKESEEVHGISDGQEESNHRRRAIPEPSAAFAPTATGTVVPSESAAACDQDLGRNEVQENRVNPHSPTTGEGRKWLSDEEWSRRIAWLGPRPIQIHTLEEQQIEPKELQERYAGQSNHPRRAVPVPEPSRPIATPGPTATATYFPPGSTAAGVENPGSSEPHEEDPVDPETLTGSMGRQWLLIKGWLRWLRRLDGSETPIEDHETIEEQLSRSEEVQEASEGQSNRPRRAVPSEPSQPIAMPGPTATAVPPESAASGIENPGSYEYQKNRANLHTIITKEGHSSSTDNEKWTKRLRWLALGNPVQVHTLEEQRIRSEELQEMSEGQSNHPGRTAAEPSQVNATPGPAATTTYVPQESDAAGVEDPGRSELQENPVDPDTFTTREFEQSLRTAGWVHRLWLWNWLGTPVDPPVQVQTSDEQRRLEEFEEQERLRKGKMPKVDSDSD